MGVASKDLHMGNKFVVFTLDCNIGPDMSSFVKWARSGLEPEPAGASLLLTEDVGEERPLSSGSLDNLLSFFSD